MDSSFTIKPRVGVQKFTSRDPRQAPETELAADKTVAAATATATPSSASSVTSMPRPTSSPIPRARDVINRENDIRNQAERASRPGAAAASRLPSGAHRSDTTPPPTEPHANIKA